jgi:hypothetical protein
MRDQDDPSWMQSLDFLPRTGGNLGVAARVFKCIRHFGGELSKYNNDTSPLNGRSMIIGYLEIRDRASPSHISKGERENDL